MLRFSLPSRLGLLLALGVGVKDSLSPPITEPELVACLYEGNAEELRLFIVVVED